MFKIQNAICRICLSNKNLINLLTSRENVHIIEKLKNIANVSFCHNDQLPKTVCQTCKQNILLLFDFKSQIEATDLKLRNVLNKNQPVTIKLEDKVLKKVLVMVPQSVNVNNFNLENSTHSTYSRHSQKRTTLVDKPIKREPNLNDANRSGLGKKTVNVRGFMPKIRTSSIKKITSFECYICHKFYQRDIYLRKHFSRIHMGATPKYQCHICCKYFVSNLERHIKDVHHKLKPYKCDICDKSFSQKIVFEGHRSTHSNYRPFKCTLCVRAYATQKQLKVHHTYCHTEKKLISKNGKKSVQIPEYRTCEYCGKQIRQTSYLQHLNLHTGEKPYSCKDCGKSFAQISARNVHQLVHSDEKPFSCTMCDMKFRRKINLNSHMLIHTGEKPHQCNFCGKFFAQKGNLTCHIRQHTGERPYHCTVCPDQFYDLNGLKRHSKGHETGS